MHIETVIYAYLAVCVSMIVFNCACVFVFRRQERTLHWRSARAMIAIRRQLLRLQAGDAVEQEHLTQLQKGLRRTRGLMVFDDALDHLRQQEPVLLAPYLRALQPVIAGLAADHHYRTPMKRAYFAYVIRKYGFAADAPASPVVDLLLALLQEPSLYCRENALLALYSTGDYALVSRALHLVDTSGRFHHAKLLTDGLLTFHGDKQALGERLWAEFDTFSVGMQGVLLDFFRFGGVRLSEELLGLLADGSRDDELRFSCIRYFGKYPDPSAYPLLLAFAEQPGARRWEYAAIAVSSLAAYPDARTIEVLKSSLYSENWYIRFNAAKSLEDSFGLSWQALSDVMDSGDRYAREIVQYRLDLQRARQEQKEVAAE